MTRLSESSFVMNCLTPVLHFVFMNLEATNSMVRGPDHETSKQVPLSKKKEHGATNTMQCSWALTST